MRLSTYYMFQNNIDSLSKAVQSGNDIYTRVASQRTLLTPSDDPSGASQAVIYQHALSSINQFETARMYAQDALGQTDNVLSSIGNFLSKNLSEKIVAGGNGTYSDQDRDALATELQGIRDNLLGLANARNSNGRFIFSGYKTGTEPFQQDGTYVGGDVPMTQIVADSTEMQVGHTGASVFMSGTDDDLFAALDKAITALKEPVGDDSDREALQATLDRVNVSIKRNIDNLGKVQAQVGTSLQKIESLNYSSETAKINMQSRLDETVGSDPDSIITLLSQSKMSDFALNSSMMVFQTMQQMSLFNILK